MDTIKQNLTAVSIGLGIMVIFFGGLYLIPTEAATTKHMRDEQAKLDGELKSLQESYASLETKLKDIAEKGREIRAKRSEIDAKIDETIAPTTEESKK